ncbi:MAG: exodeoxyribonuclease VII large subunit [Agathobacter sp.]|nr:exodeoxyribonuclease VII large subunit [Agathobacter sp.]
MNKNIYSVGQINNYIKNMFSQDFMLRNISVKGEISNCKYHTSGHIYFTIKDAAGTISAIMFAGSRRGLGFTMKEGDKVIVTGSVEVYEKTGSYQLYARQIELDGAGNLYLQFEKLKNELGEMGYFAEEYKIPIPKYARRIGIVTAPTGAAIQDIRNISKRRNPYVELILYPALVQGDGAAQSIVNGIYALEQIGVDIIIVGRGGGSIEDLWAFNEKIVADAIFNCRIPTISAVGHETDWTIADFVADMRAPTPSAAAELAVFDYRQVQDKLYEYNRRMQNSLYNKLELSRQKLNSYKLKLDYLSPEHRLNENRRRLMEYEEKLKLRIDMIIKEKKHMLELYAGRLEACSPVKKLGQGYAYVEDYNGKSLRSVEGVEKNQDITIYLLDGKIKTVVSEVIPNE